MTNESLIGKALTKNTNNNDGLNCPLCGGEAGRRLNNICVKIFYAFLFFAVLALIIFIISCFGNSSLLLILGITSLPFLGIIIVLLLLILPVMAAISIASRSRCKACGHRFWPNSIAPNLPANVRSPGLLSVISIMILLSVFFIQVSFIRNSPGNEMINVSFEIAGWIFLAPIILGLCMIGQAFFWRNFVGEIHTGRKYSILFLLPFLLLISVMIALPFSFRYAIANEYIYISRAKDVLSRAKLATLPVSASNIRIYTPQMIFSSSDYLGFKADPNDIEKFIKDSPELEGPRYETYLTWFNDKPSWFNHKQADRVYKFDKRRDTYHGRVIVDDNKHIVYVERWE